MPTELELIGIVINDLTCYCEDDEDEEECQKYLESLRCELEGQLPGLDDRGAFVVALHPKVAEKIRSGELVSMDEVWKYGGYIVVWRSTGQGGACNGLSGAEIVYTDDKVCVEYHGCLPHVWGPEYYEERVCFRRRVRLAP